MKKREILRIFEAHGVDFTGQRGNQMYGYCPFSNKEDKFYVNTTNGLWDSKTAGLSGDVAKFLQLRSNAYREELKSTQLKLLSENRQLPMNAFREWETGWNGRDYTFPVRDYKGRVVDIRRFSVRANMLLSTPGASVGLFGAHRLKERPKDPVYLCEGEWDAIAMHWLLKICKEPGVVVGVPGAGTFKDEWVSWFQDRIVHTMYDYDPPGQAGEQMVTKKLSGHIRRLTYVHWPDEVPVGFDTRDWVVYGVTVRDTPMECLSRLKKRFFDHPKDTSSTTRVQMKDGRITITRKKVTSSRWANKPPTIADVHTNFNKWLFLRNTDVIDVMLATVLSQRIDGSPIWMFLVGPPGSAKTVVISSLQETDQIYSTSTLTAPSLISGANFTGAADPSLIPKLDEKVLVVKDFTSILSLSDREQKEIFGILRDAYDGRCGKTFGNGVSRHYESRFTVLAASTPKIYDLSEHNQALGERFLKFLVGDNLHHESESEIIRKAIENSDRETVMRKELQDTVKSFLERTCAKRETPKISPEFTSKIVALAKFGARMRGSVSRDHYHNDIVMSRPTAEVGTRLGQQLAKFARSMAMVYGKKEVTQREYILTKKVMLDTISQRNEDMIRTMVKAMGGMQNLTPLSMREIGLKTHYPFATIQRLCQDLQALQIIQRKGNAANSTWTLSDYVLKELREAELYSDEDLKRTTIGKIRLYLKRVKEHPRKIRINPAMGKVVSIQSSGPRMVLVPPPKPVSVPAPPPVTSAPVVPVVEQPLPVANNE